MGVEAQAVHDPITDCASVSSQIVFEELEPVLVSPHSMIADHADRLPTRCIHMWRALPVKLVSYGHLAACLTSLLWLGTNMDVLGYSLAS